MKTKYSCFIFILFAFYSCSIHKQLSVNNNQLLNLKSQKIFKQELQLIIDSSNVDGSILVYDPQKQLYYSNNFKWAEIGKLPASTFKIPNSIIALETGIVKNEKTIFKWNGEKRKLAVWEKDLSFQEAFHLSCVPCYQEIAKKLGVRRMKDFLLKFNYGKMEVDSNTIDLFWLEGDSKINQFQQIDFLMRFYNSELSIKKRTERIMKGLIIIDHNASYTVSGKTGWSIRNGNNNGWFVGYIESDAKHWFFAINIEPHQAFNMDMFPMIRKEIAIKGLKVLGIIK
ncbi:MAG: class D beta-lactamase [Bacteroidales bacterium]